MDHRIPGSNNNDAFANNGLFADTHHFTPNDTLYQNGANFSNLPDASWGVNAGEYNSSAADQSRGPASGVPSWQQNANHLAASSVHQGYNGMSSPYGRSMHQSPAAYNQNSFANYGSSQNYPYRPPQYAPGNGQNFNIPNHAFTTSAPNAGTIAPQALDHNRNFVGGPYGVHNNFAQNGPAVPQQTPRVDPNALVNQLPKGVNGGFFSIINFDDLSRTTNSERMGSYANVGRQALEWDISRGTLPAYVPRKSRNELRALAGNNASALAKIGKKAKSQASGQQIKYEGESSSDDGSSSEEDSDDSSDDESDSPLPQKRPESSKGGVEYDVIKALWRSKRKTIDGPTIRKALADYWEIIKTIRDRWKADQTAFTDAEEKKKAGELPLLKSRVKDQREMAEAAFRAALKHGHRGIIELLAENVALIFVCYQFLLDRLKDEDVNGPLSRALLELMSAFTTLSNEKLEKTHLVKVLPRYQKKGDAKTQHYIKRILANAEAATKEAAAKSDSKKEGQTNPADKADPSKKSAPEAVAGVKRPASASSMDGAAAKKVASGTVKANSSSSTTRLTGNGAIKKPTTASDVTKPTATGGAPTVTKKAVMNKPSGFFSSLQSATKKPGTSNAEKTNKSVASKAAVSGVATAPAVKPAFSFAETMANLSKPKKEEQAAAKPEEKALPEETPEEKAKRLRKEQRRKLHVSFKAGADLVQIRYFTHDPDEEIDHDSSQMRDISDSGGEGRALKQHMNMMDLDDDDEPVEPEQTLMDYRQPLPIDFSVVDDEERQRNYAPHGGGTMQPDSAERHKRDQYERSTLMVFYSNYNEIPANPKDPDEPYNGEQGGVCRSFGLPEEKYVARALQFSGNRSGDKIPPTLQNQPPAPAPGFDMSAFMATQQQQQAGQGGLDISALLATLSGGGGQHAIAAQQSSAPAYMQQYGQAMAGYTPPPPPPPPQQQQQQQIPAMAAIPDLSKILAQIQGQQAPQHQQQQQPRHNFGAQGSSGANVHHPNYKTKTCKFWQVGACQKGDACSFLHE